MTMKLIMAIALHKFYVTFFWTYHNSIKKSIVPVDAKPLTIFSDFILSSSPVTVTSPSDFAPASSKEFLDIQATVECGFTLKRVRDMARTYSQMHRTDKYPEHSSIIWPVWPNG